jgi:hypothetical protein
MLHGGTRAELLIHVPIRTLVIFVHGRQSGSDANRRGLGSILKENIRIHSDHWCAVELSAKRLTCIKAVDCECK